MFSQYLKPLFLAFVLLCSIKSFYGKTDTANVYLTLSQNLNTYYTGTDSLTYKYLVDSSGVTQITYDHTAFSTQIYETRLSFSNIREVIRLEEDESIYLELIERPKRVHKYSRFTQELEIFHLISVDTQEAPDVCVLFRAAILCYQMTRDDRESWEYDVFSRTMIRSYTDNYNQRYTISIPLDDIADVYYRDTKIYVCTSNTTIYYNFPTRAHYAAQYQQVIPAIVFRQIRSIWLPTLN